MYKQKQNDDETFCASNLQTNFSLKLDFRKVDCQTRGKWLIHGATHRKGKRWQNLEISFMISWLEN